MTKKDECNENNHLAFSIVSGLAGWMQMNCAKGIGYAIREESARLVLTEILQAQKANYWIRIQKTPDDWREYSETLKVDVCLGSAKKTTASNYGVIEIKWPWEVPDGTRDNIRRDMLQDIARLSTMKGQSTSYIRYFVFGCMDQAIAPLFETQHPRAKPLEAERILLNEMLSCESTNPTRILNRNEILSVFPDFENRIPEQCKLGSDGSIETTLLACQNIDVGTVNLGAVYV